MKNFCNIKKTLLITLIFSFSFNSYAAKSCNDADNELDSSLAAIDGLEREVETLNKNIISYWDKAKALENKKGKVKRPNLYKTYLDSIEVFNDRKKTKRKKITKLSKDHQKIAKKRNKICSGDGPKDEPKADPDNKCYIVKKIQEKRQIGTHKVSKKVLSKETVCDSDKQVIAEKGEIRGNRFIAPSDTATSLNRAPASYPQAKTYRKSPGYSSGASNLKNSIKSGAIK